MLSSALWDGSEKQSVLRGGNPPTYNASFQPDPPLTASSGQAGGSSGGRPGKGVSHRGCSGPFTVISPSPTTSLWRENVLGVQRQEVMEVGPELENLVRGWEGEIEEY